MHKFRFLYWGWNGYFDVMEECSDTYMTPKRVGIGWGDLYINMHKHDWISTQGHLAGVMALCLLRYWLRQ